MKNGKEVESRPRLAEASMKILGFTLLLSGWGIAFTSVALLATGTARVAFVLAGLGVEAIGLALVARAHPLPRGSRG
jgi:hypothetical protein